MARAAEPLPFWPALMDSAMAARYLALGEGSFRALAARSGLAPVEVGLSVTRWRRTDLDGLVDKLPMRGGLGSGAEEVTIDPASAALERAAMRVRGRRK